MDIELVTDPYECMMYIVSPLAGVGGEYCGGLPPTVCFIYNYSSAYVYKNREYLKLSRHNSIK